jgi:hypothetical protein
MRATTTGQQVADRRCTTSTFSICPGLRAGGCGNGAGIFPGRRRKSHDLARHEQNRVLPATLVGIDRPAPTAAPQQLEVGAVEMDRVGYGAVVEADPALQPTQPIERRHVTLDLAVGPH